MIDEYLLYRLDLAENTKTLYTSHIQRFIVFMSAGGVPLLSTTSADIERFLYDLQRQKLSGSYRHTAWVALKGFFEWLALAGRLPANPFDKHIKCPKFQPSDIDPAELDFIEKMIDHCQRRDDMIGWRDAAILRLLLNGGLRRSECAGIKLSDVKWATREISVVGKGAIRRTIYPSDNTMACISTWLDHRPQSPDNALFLTSGRKTGTPRRLRADTINRIFTNIQRSMGVPKEERIKPHQIRHTFGTEFVDNHGNLFVLQKLMGHKDLASTQRYVRLKRKTIREQAAMAAPDI